MKSRYTLLSAATYIPLSPNEVVVKGSALEGFSLLVEDPEKRGITASLVAALERGGRTPQELASVLDVANDDCAAVLESLRLGGALSCVDDDATVADVEAAWSAFVRYGELPPPDLLRTVTVATSGSTGSALDIAQAWGVPVQVVDVVDLDPAAYAEAEVTEVGNREETPVRRDRSPLVHLSFEAERSEVYRLNEQSVSAGVSVLYARLDGVEYAVGPYVVPGRTACAWETERSWARSSADREQYEMLLRHRQRAACKAAAPRAVGDVGFGSALAPHLLELALRGSSERAGSVVHGRATTQTTSTHSVMRLPRCPVCMPMQPLTRNPLY